MRNQELPPGLYLVLLALFMAWLLGPPLAFILMDPVMPIGD